MLSDYKTGPPLLNTTAKRRPRQGNVMEEFSFEIEKALHNSEEYTGVCDRLAQRVYQPLFDFFLRIYNER